MLTYMAVPFVAGGALVQRYARALARASPARQTSASPARIGSPPRTRPPALDRRVSASDGRGQLPTGGVGFRRERSALELSERALARRLVLAKAQHPRPVADAAIAG